MALEHKDRISDTSNTTGTGTLTLTGSAPTGRRSFASGHTTGSTIHYAIESSDKLQWEVGEGVWTSSGSTLTRVTVFASSNAGALVNFTGTPLTVISTMTSADAGSVSGIMDKIRIYRTATGVNSTSAGDQKVPLNLVDYDTNSLWDAGNTRIVPKKPGYYMCTARIRRNSSGLMVFQIWKNGSSLGSNGPDINANGTFGSGIVYCNGTTDYVECGVYANSVVEWSAFDNWMTVVGPF